MFLRLRLYRVELLLAAVLAAAVAYFGFLVFGLLTPSFVLEPFSADRALQYASQQLEFGPRPTGSPGNAEMGDWLVDELRLLGWDVTIQPFTAANGTQARNIIAVKSDDPSSDRAGLLMTHYDTRLVSDRDPEASRQADPTPGANAGASGAAVLLELARSLDVPTTKHTICLVFLDAEENDGIEGWGTTMGADVFVQRLASDLPRCDEPRFAVYLDMIGNFNQRIYAESTSYPPLTSAIWSVGAELGHGNIFINETTWSSVDAHTRMLELNVPAATIADYSYPLRYTTSDTVDQLSVESFGRIGSTLKTWLERGASVN